MSEESRSVGSVSNLAREEDDPTRELLLDPGPVLAAIRVAGYPIPQETECLGLSVDDHGALRIKVRDTPELREALREMAGMRKAMANAQAEVAQVQNALEGGLSALIDERKGPAQTEWIGVCAAMALLVPASRAAARFWALCPEHDPSRHYCIRCDTLHEGGYNPHVSKET